MSQYGYCEGLHPTFLLPTYPKRAVRESIGSTLIVHGIEPSPLCALSRICLLPFIATDPDTLSNAYFKTLLKWNKREIEYGEASFIPTDVALVVDEGLRKYVVTFSKNENLFFRTFVSAYQKLVDSTATSRTRY